MSGNGTALRLSLMLILATAFAGCTSSKVEAPLERFELLIEWDGVSGENWSISLSAYFRDEQIWPRITEAVDDNRRLSLETINNHTLIVIDMSGLESPFFVSSPDGPMAFPSVSSYGKPGNITHQTGAWMIVEGSDIENGTLSFFERHPNRDDCDVGSETIWSIGFQGQGRFEPEPAHYPPTEFLVCP